MDASTSTAPVRVKAPRNQNRAKACNHCRKRKTKCDGRRPICTQCQARSKPGLELLCEYPVVGHTRKRTLEESISTLERRIRELERAESDEDAIRLYDPSNYPSTSSSPFGTSSNSPSSSSSLLLDSSTPEPSLFATAFQEEIPVALGQRLLQAFIPHAQAFGFFLNIRRFISATTLPLTLGDYSRPCPGLVCVIYLIGLHLSGATEDEESAFLSRALLHVSNVLSASHPLRLIHGTQAEILLSTYFFRTGRILEGKYHLSAAVSLATCADLHKLRSGNMIPFIPNVMGFDGPSLPDPKDLIDEGERINAFWTVFTMCNCWGVGVGGFSSMMFESYGSRIDTPWPLDMEDYEENRVPANYIGTSTVRNFLSQAPIQPLRVNGPSRMALLAQASLLLDRAASLRSSYANELHSDEHTRYMKTFASLDALIDSFYSSLLSFSQTYVSSPEFMTVWATHLICRVATIKLHNIFTASNVFSRKKVLECAEACVMLCRGRDLTGIEVNPVFGLLWRIVGEAIIVEISRIDALSRQALSLPNWGLEETAVLGRVEMVALLEELFLTMELFGSRSGSKIIAYQLNSLQENYHSNCIS
ncbi:Zn(2)-Cys(6) binuclear cluster domain-containing protein [Lentinula aciculospora]|uniref:Zn(2)-Cys(6) binuclear cluster domain-containing protein n=1 Tax=Lentinula aciculospora TaxID=153920 RepID=A0A9W9A5R1_9AGAR|nr:Zn(2)-Cys(6) binuclear cluster domain-containing protein [Lentinula aciculospora]